MRNFQTYNKQIFSFSGMRKKEKFAVTCRPQSANSPKILILHTLTGKYLFYPCRPEVIRAGPYVNLLK